MSPFDVLSFEIDGLGILLFIAAWTGLAACIGFWEWYDSPRRRGKRWAFPLLRPRVVVSRGGAG